MGTHDPNTVIYPTVAAFLGLKLGRGNRTPSFWQGRIRREGSALSNMEETSVSLKPLQRHGPPTIALRMELGRPSLTFHHMGLKLVSQFWGFCPSQEYRIHLLAHQAIR
jgi:hypothetical protein